MSRHDLRYRDGATAPVDYEGFDPDTPIVGFYRTRLVSGGVFCGVRIFRGPPLDPETGEELDRGYVWRAQANGAEIPVERVWPKCARDTCDEATHDHLIRLGRWGADHGHAAVADPRKRLDTLSAPLPF